MDIELTYDAAIAETALTINGKLTGNQNLGITLSGHKAYKYGGGPQWWDYHWYFTFRHEKQNYILEYNSCSQGSGWFLREAPKADLKKKPVCFHDFNHREPGHWCRVDVLAEHAVIDRLLGESCPRHCRGY